MPKSFNKKIKKERKKSIIISIVVSTVTIAVTAILLFLIKLGGPYGVYQGMKTREVWEPIENLLNEYTDDHYEVIDQTGEGLFISFDDGVRMIFSCEEKNLINGGIAWGNGIYCKMKIGEDQLTNIGGYYTQKNRTFIDRTVKNVAGIKAAKTYRGEYGISYDNLGNVEDFFYRMLENEDFYNLYEMYKSCGGLYKDSNLRYGYYKVDEGHPVGIIDSNMIYAHSAGGNLDGEEGLFEIATENNWNSSSSSIPKGTSLQWQSKGL